MPKTSLVWKADDVFNTAFSCQIANAGRNLTKAKKTLP
jgi:hypothetical protein